MGNNNENQNKPSPPVAQGGTSSPQAPSASRVNVLSDEQFAQFLKEHRKSTIYAAALAGHVFSRAGVTATPKNMEIVKSLAEATLAMMEGK